MYSLTSRDIVSDYAVYLYVLWIGIAFTKEPFGEIESEKVCFPSSSVEFLFLLILCR
jgi:hypothetical protein